MGGMVTIAFVGKYPDRTIAACADCGLARCDLYRRTLFRTWRSMAEAMPLDEMSDAITVQAVGADYLEEHPETFEIVRSIIGKNSHHTIRQACVAMEEMDIEHLARQIRRPILLTNGTHDTMTPPASPPPGFSAQDIVDRGSDWATMFEFPDHRPRRPARGPRRGRPDRDGVLPRRAGVRSMSTYDRLASLELVVDGYELERLETAGLERLHPRHHDRRLARATATRDAARTSATRRPTTIAAEPDLAGRFTVDSFSERLGGARALRRRTEPRASSATTAAGRTRAPRSTSRCARPGRRSGRRSAASHGRSASSSSTRLDVARLARALPRPRVQARPRRPTGIESSPTRSRPPAACARSTSRPTTRARRSTTRRIRSSTRSAWSASRTP